MRILSTILHTRRPAGRANVNVFLMLVLPACWPFERSSVAMSVRQYQHAEFTAA